MMGRSATGVGTFARGAVLAGGKPDLSTVVSIMAAAFGATGNTAADGAGRGAGAAGAWATAAFGFRVSDFEFRADVGRAGALTRAAAKISSKSLRSIRG
jgi:hypothetical protein